MGAVGGGGRRKRNRKSKPPEEASPDDDGSSSASSDDDDMSDDDVDVSMEEMGGDREEGGQGVVSEEGTGVGQPGDVPGKISDKGGDVKDMAPSQKKEGQKEYVEGVTASKKPAVYISLNRRSEIQVNGFMPFRVAKMHMLAFADLLIYESIVDSSATSLWHWHQGIPGGYIYIYIYTNTTI